MEGKAQHKGKAGSSNENKSLQEEEIGPSSAS